MLLNEVYEMMEEYQIGTDTFHVSLIAALTEFLKRHKALFAIEDNQPKKVCAIAFAGHLIQFNYDYE